MGFFFRSFFGLLVAAALLVGTGLFFLMKAVWNHFLPASVVHRKRWRILGGLLSAAALLGIGFLFWRDLLIFVAYLPFLAGLLELVFRLIRRILKNRRPFGQRMERFLSFCGKIWRSRLLPFALSALIVLLGAVNLANPRTTAYELTATSPSAGSLNALPDGKLTVYFLSDIHVGTIQNPESVHRYLQAIAAEKPDLLLLGGDLTDESSSKEDMLSLFEWIGQIQTTYGIYAVDGNHDRQKYASDGSRTFSSAEYASAMEANGIRLLSDECVETDAFRIIGRKDASDSSRKAGNSILTDEQRADPKYTILLDHQPNGGTAEDWSDADLVLCGHTHGGQVFPAGLLIELFGYNAGLYKDGDRTLIVSTGVAGWGFKTKTQGRAEGVKIVLSRAQ
ncbi:MAG: metallophosphoesterase [Clostridia bacterium]|nr:metallophosphoesterase [Clostridia bacterium]